MLALREAYRVLRIMPSWPHGKTTPSFWAGAVPTAVAFANGVASWRCVELSFTRAGFVYGFSLYDSGLQSPGCWAVLFTRSGGNIVRVKEFFQNPLASPTWRNCWCSPRFKPNVGDHYLLGVLFSNKDFYYNPLGLVAPQTNNSITYHGSSVRTEIDLSKSQDPAFDQNLPAIDVLFGP